MENSRLRRVAFITVRLGVESKLWRSDRRIEGPTLVLFFTGLRRLQKLIKQARPLRAGPYTKMLKGELRGHPSVWRVIEKADLDQVWLDYFLDRIFVFMNGS